MPKIAETYINLKIDPSEKFIENSKAYLFQRANIFAKEIFKGEPSVCVIVDDGSYKVWVSVATAIYIVISGYGSFRSGIDHLVKDSRKFSEFFISDFINESKISKEKIFRIERRLGIPGKIQRLLKRIDNLGTHMNLTQSIEIINGKPVISQKADISPDKDEIESIKNEIIRIFEYLESDKDRKIFYDSLPEEFRDELPDDFSEMLLRLPKRYIYRKEDELLPELPVVKKLPPPE